MTLPSYHRAVTAAIVLVVAVIVLEVCHRKQAETSAAPPVTVVQSAPNPADPFAARIGNIDFANTPLRTAIRTLAERSGVSLAGDWTALAQTDESTHDGTRVDGISATQPVSIHLHDATLGDALNALCNQWPLADVHAGIATDPGGILVLGAWRRNGDGSVRTIPRFDDVSDWIGDVSKYPPPKKLTGPAALALAEPQRDERPDLVRLADALSPFAGAGEVDCFANRLMVGGYESAHENILATLERLRHPISLFGPVERVYPPPDMTTIKGFRVPSGTTARRALQLWQKLDPTHSVIEAIPEDDLSTEPADWVAPDSTSDWIVGILASNYRWPLIVIPRGEEDDRTHVRRFRMEQVPRAYDVRQILLHPERWIEGSGQGRPSSLTAEETLIDLIQTRFEAEGPGGLNFEYEGRRATCWNGILLWRESPEVQRRIFRLLKFLHQKGRLPDFWQGE